MKKFIFALPEYLLIGSVVFYWVSTANVFNPFAIVLILVLILQIIFKNKVVGLVIPSLLIVASLYMLLALFSEFREFPQFNSEAKLLLFVGLSYFLLTISVASLMIYKYAIRSTKAS
jgi:hypothetical protein